VASTGINLRWHVGGTPTLCNQSTANTESDIERAA